MNVIQNFAPFIPFMRITMNKYIKSLKKDLTIYTKLTTSLSISPFHSLAQNWHNSAQNWHGSALSP